VLYSDLTMTVALSGQAGRAPAYFQAFAQGQARFYHLPQKTFLAKFKQHIAAEIRYLALAATRDEPTSKQIDHLWPVQNVTLLPRRAISVAQAGKASDSSEPYYLFELGRPLRLQRSVTHVPHRPLRNSMKLTTLTRLEQAERFAALEPVYTAALHTAEA
ncbi:MAG: restriction endonuclease-like protein, partial [Shewanella sp.]